jgi:hypothetical protein
MAIHPRLTFKTGTLGRFIQLHGIRADWREVPPTDPPRKDYWIRLFLPDGRMIEFWGRISGDPSVEKSLDYAASIAHDWELAGGTPSGLAQLYGLDDTKSGSFYAHYEEIYYKLIAFLGIATYMDLIAFLEGPESAVEA